MMIGLIFLAALVAFVLIILFLVWYYKLMANMIFGSMNDMLSNVVYDGIPPEKWNKRVMKLNKTLKDPNKSPQKKSKAIDKYIRFMELSTKDMSAYAKKTVFLESDYERDEAVEAIERFYEEQVQIMEDAKEAL